MQNTKVKKYSAVAGTRTHNLFLHVYAICNSRAVTQIYYIIQCNKRQACTALVIDACSQSRSYAGLPEMEVKLRGFELDVFDIRSLDENNPNVDGFFYKILTTTTTTTTTTTLLITLASVETKCPSLYNLPFLCNFYTY